LVGASTQSGRKSFGCSYQSHCHPAKLAFEARRVGTFRLFDRRAAAHQGDAVTQARCLLEIECSARCAISR
jgi:hypothetical protein